MFKTVTTRLVIPLITLFAVTAVAVACELEEEQTSPPLTTTGDNAATATPTAEPTPRAGFARIGSLEIQVLRIERFDATPHNMFNEENLRLHVTVRKVKGDEYDFTLNEWTLVTSTGRGYENSIFCVDCPDAVDELVLYGDNWVEAYVYFEIPAGTHTFTEIRYEPLFSTSKGSIPTDVTVTIN